MMEVEHNGRTYEVEGRWADLGIGPYECHGRRGVDVSWEFEVERVTLDGVEVEHPYDDEELIAAINAEAERRAEPCED